MDPRVQALKAARDYPDMMMVLPQPDALEFFYIHLKQFQGHCEEDAQYVQELEERLYDWHKLIVDMKKVSRGESGSRFNFWQEEEA
jgi:hypothetical protein